jgi:hypothetical protein
MNRETAKANCDSSTADGEIPALSLVDLLSVEPDMRATRGGGSKVRPQTGVTLGVLAGIDESGNPLVDYAENAGHSPRVARSTVPFDLEDLGRDAVLVLAAGDVEHPIMLGLIQNAPLSLKPTQGDRDEPSASLDAVIDGKRIVLSGEDEIELRCGKASITLTRAGKILIRGAYLLSRSSGVNRIKGGSVQIN